jgi:hypothetical protein
VFSWLLEEDWDLLLDTIADSISAWGGHDPEEARSEADGAMRIFREWLRQLTPSENSGE